jgi:hypothetical protein
MDMIVIVEHVAVVVVDTMLMTVLQFA